MVHMYVYIFNLSYKYLLFLSVKTHVFAAIPYAFSETSRHAEQNTGLKGYHVHQNSRH